MRKRLTLSEIVRISRQFRLCELEQHAARIGDAEPSACVIHYTGGPGVASRWLRSAPEVSRSYHVEIARNGIAYWCVPLDRCAWHAGRSEIQIGAETMSGANDYTIGIALSNLGLLQVDTEQLGPDGEPQYHYTLGGRQFLYEGPTPVAGILSFDGDVASVCGMWEPYSAAQIATLKLVLAAIRQAGYTQAASTLVGHEEIGMPLGRKSDPGPHFPWDLFPSGYPVRRTRRLLSFKGGA